MPRAVAPTNPMAPDDEKKEDQVFDYGDRTIFQLRTQAFAIESEYGTIMGAPAAPDPQPVETAAAPAEDPMTRLEQKLDLALRQISVLQHKIDSIDATLARLLNR